MVALHLEEASAGTASVTPTPPPIPISTFPWDVWHKSKRLNKGLVEI